MEEIDIETLRGIFEYLKGHLKNIDKGFFGGLRDILFNISNRILHSEIETPATLPCDIDFQTLTDKVEEFYRTLNPNLGAMARNLLRNACVYVPIENLSAEDINFQKSRKKNSCLLEAMADHIPLSNSYEGVIVIAHEIAHSFKMTSNYEYQTHSILHYLFNETLAIYAELLCRDFIKEQYNIEENSLLAIRYNYMYDYMCIYREYIIQEITILELFERYISLLRDEELTDDNILKFRTFFLQMRKLYSDIFERQNFSEWDKYSYIASIDSLFDELPHYSFRLYICYLFI